MEYAKLEKPLYWMGFTKGKFTKRKFVEYQVPFPRHLRDEEGNIRFFSRNMENVMNEIDCNGYSQYSYEEYDLSVICETDSVRRAKSFLINNNHKEKIKDLEILLDMYERFERDFGGKKKRGKGK